MKKTIDRKIIVLTPIKNEAWFLDIFLKATSIWADVIILSDQYSTDVSRKIAAKYKKVALINGAPLRFFNEFNMRNILFEEARKIKGEKILFSIDADEIITPDFFNSSELNKILSSKPGTVIKFKWANICPNLKNFWSPDFYLPKGFVDDGSPYKAGRIHTLNIPYPKAATVVACKNSMLMHFQYVDWERMNSKHRWYQCWERINSPMRSPIRIYRQYHHMYSVKKSDLKMVPDRWLQEYKKYGVDLKSFNKSEDYWYDREVLSWLDKYGTKHFERLDIWDKDWIAFAKRQNYQGKKQFSDPRNIAIKAFHKYLKVTQPYSDSKFVKHIDTFFDKVIQIIC